MKRLNTEVTAILNTIVAMLEDYFVRPDNDYGVYNSLLN